MSKLFPPMSTRPKPVYAVATLFWWGMAFALIPMYLPILCLGIWENHMYMSWFEIGYHIVNAVVAGAFLKDHFSEGWFMVGIDKKFYIGHVTLTLGLMIGATAVMSVVFWLFGIHPLFLTNAFPVVELSVALTPGYLIILQPIFGTASMILFAPIAVCGLLYGVGFAPFCGKRPWLAYVIVAVTIFVPVLVDILWRGDTELMLMMYLMQLPVHLLACWSYQKTDNICTPVMALAGINLLGAVVNILIG